MGILHLSRPYDAGAVLRRVWVTVDGLRVAGLRPGQSVDVPVTAGLRVVQAALDWTRSEPLSVRVDGSATVSVEASLPVDAYWRAFVTPSRALDLRMVLPHRGGAGGPESAVPAVDLVRTLTRIASRRSDTRAPQLCRPAKK
ncbi:hypothetical protein [Micromonospora cathayae]|uniref:Uncharacterized protein n=1 Tax=Micromonospora cathayae TaxID=3028804 RepID=A0ABY7ZUS3_9ACTN|nr:hypothetical protein [Micromonospora sp. HUAS 3]WDZ86710.1 hypothetical protein PVK37_10085 [Micromonospora sp. HUAS 3]